MKICMKICAQSQLTRAGKLKYIMIMIKKGTIAEIIFSNKVSGYGILVVQEKNGSFIATGNFGPVGKGQDVELEGEFQMNERYGNQFVATKIKIAEPTSCESIVKYLSSGLITGVGVVTANNIVGRFKENTLEIIEKEPKLLAQIKGISERKALEISQCYQDIKKMQNAVMFLQQYEISITMAVKIYEAYRENTQSVLRKNPYKLIEDVEGIGFKTADKIAFKMGINKESNFRIRAGIVYCINEYAEKQGSTVVETSKVVESTLGLLELPSEYEGEILSELSNLQIEGSIKSTLLEEESAISITKFYNAEKYIADKIKLLISSAPELNANYGAEIAEFEHINDISLHESQKRAIETSCREGVSIITGGPGTGKTTIIKAIISILENHGNNIKLFAPTGRAAKRMEEQTKRPASTIHRGLEFGYNGGRLSFAINENNNLDCDVVIVDEVSMIDVNVMSSLLKALKFGTKLIMVGDKDQLMSVGAGNVLGDMIESGVVAVSELTQIFRQAENSAIIVNAHLINEGTMPDLMAKTDDFFYSSTYEPSAVAKEIVELVSSRIPSFRKDIKPEDIQIIAPMKAGEAGVNNLNEILREKLNPKSASKDELEVKKRIFRVGDRVMQTTNNYDLEWIKVEHGKVVGGVGVFNGDMGYIDEINTQNGEIYVSYDDGRRAGYSIVELDDLVLAYAITIHKSQGSEFDVVIIPILGGNPMLYNRNLLYTAVTRAKKMVILIGKKGSIYLMIKNNYTIKRNTNLKKFLQSESALLS